MKFKKSSDSFMKEMSLSIFFSLKVGNLKRYKRRRKKDNKHKSKFRYDFRFLKNACVSIALKQFRNVT